MSEKISFILALLLIVPGIGMALIPMLPALSYMFVIALAYAAFGGFEVITGQELLILLSIVVVSILIDHTSGILGAKYGGAHTKSLLWGIGGAILGTVLFPPLGSFIGLFAAVLASEMYYRKPTDKALKAAGSALLGTAVGVGVNIVLAIAFAVTFFFFVV